MTATATASVTIAVPVITAGACPALPAVKAMGVIGNSCGNIRDCVTRSASPGLQQQRDADAADQRGVRGALRNRR